MCLAEIGATAAFLGAAVALLKSIGVITIPAGSLFGVSGATILTVAGIGGGVLACVQYGIAAMAAQEKNETLAMLNQADNARHEAVGAISGAIGEFWKVAKNCKGYGTYCSVLGGISLLLSARSALETATFGNTHKMVDATIRLDNMREKQLQKYNEKAIAAHNAREQWIACMKQCCREDWDSGGAGRAHWEAPTRPLGSYGPNDIIGPRGVGEANWVTAARPLHYTIRFENDPAVATAPARTVTITQQLDADLDLRTFRVGDFGFGPVLGDVPDGASYYVERLDLIDELGLSVDVAAGINVLTGEAFWSFISIDPDTGAPFVGEPNRAYAFHCVAVDRAGNAEPMPPVPDSQTVVDGPLSQPGGVAIDVRPYVGGQFNPVAPGSRSLSIVGLDTAGDKTTTLYALKVGNDPNAGWLRFIGAGSEAVADGTTPDWQSADRWIGARVTGLDAGTTYAFSGKAADVDLTAETDLIALGSYATNLDCDVNRNGLATALDLALIRAAIQGSGFLGGSFAWACDTNGDGVIDDADGVLTRDRVLNPIAPPGLGEQAMAFLAAQGGPASFLSRALPLDLDGDGNVDGDDLAAAHGDYFDPVV